MSITGYSADVARPLHPPDKFDLIRHLSSYVHEGKDAKGSRKIFHKVSYTEYEKDHIRQFEAAMIKSGLSLPQE